MTVTKEGLEAPEDAIEELLSQERWAAARDAIQQELERSPDDHWLMTRLSGAYYEEREYQKALEWSEKARALAPSCPLVLWDLAGALDMLGREREALGIYVSLIRRGVAAVAEDECGEGERWASALLADCVYRCACCLEDLGERDRARRMFKSHLLLVSLGARGVYGAEDVAKKLAELNRLRRRAGIKKALESALADL